MLLLLACVDHPPDETGLRAPTGADTSGSEDTDGEQTETDESGTITPDEVVCPEPNAYTPEADRPARVLDGEITWTLAFDEAAEAAGFRDCAYTRLYSDFYETNLKPWLCPECSLITTGDAVMTSGYEDCFAQISDDDATRVEQLGLAEVDGVLTFYRSGVENVALGALGTVVGDAAAFSVSWEDESALTDADGNDAGNMVLSAVGSLTASDSDRTLTDPYGASDAPYACGWPQCDPGGPPPSWTLENGQVFPNITFEDQCGEPVSLWDFWGQWILLDASSPNCGPCQVMAQNEAVLIDELRSQGINATFVTLLNESLSTVNIPADLATVQDWAETFALESPVLADPGFAYATFPPYMDESDGSMSFPTVIVIGPDMTIRGWDSGFSEETMFEDILAIIGV